MNQQNNQSGDWSQYLQSYEPQSYRNFDTDECSDLGGIISPMEIYYNWLKETNQIPEPYLNFLISKGYWNGTSFAFSERYFGIRDGTTENGNLMQNGYKAFPTVGFIPRSMLEWTAQEAAQYPTQDLMDTTYYDPSVITPEMDALALEFLSYIKEFEWGFVYDFPTALKTSPLGIAIPIPAPTSLWNQQYVPYTGGRITQHCVCLYRYDGTQTYPNYVTDQYQPFLKQLQNNYMIPVAISFKVILKQTPTSVPIVVKKPFWPRWITSLFTKW